MESIYIDINTFEVNNITDYSDNGLYSQNGEYGIIKAAILRMNLFEGIAVEFGAADGFYCSNTADLCNEFNWKRYMYDLVPTGHGITQMEINEDNINILPKCDLLSIDIDGNDFNIWKAYGSKPAIVIIEINSSLDPDVEFFHPSRGASFCTMNRLAEDKGYFLLCHTGNCIYVDNRYKHLFPDASKEFNKQWLQVQQ